MCLYILLFIALFFATHNAQASQNYFIDYQDTCKAEVSKIGNKTAGLVQLAEIKSLKIPEWFCVTTYAFDEFIQNYHLHDMTKKLETLSQQWRAATDREKPQLESLIFECAAALRNNIEIHDHLKHFYQELIQKCLQFKKVYNVDTFAIRSSGTVEDLPSSSYAGLYDTFLNQKTCDEIANSIKRCWASVFNDRAVMERVRTNKSQETVSTAILVQNMVKARVAGTAFTMEISTGFPCIEIAATYGLGEGVVGGEITSDKWLVHPKTNHILKSIIGTKRFAIIFSPERSGTNKIDTPIETQKKTCLSNLMVKQLATTVKEIGQHFKQHFNIENIDTEFAFDDNGILYFLQARPLVNVSRDTYYVVDPKSARQHNIIAQGKYSLAGTVHGKVKVIKSWEELASGQVKIEPEDIVVTYLSTNYWSNYMINFTGMITQEGSPTSHPILLCRERKVPCVIGIAHNFEKLLSYDGKYITLDGTNRLIYEGLVDLQKANSKDFLQQFETVCPEPLPSFETTKKDLKTYNLVFIEKEGTDETLWVITPSYPMGRLLQEINLLRYDRRATLVGRQNWPTVAKVINSYVCDKLFPFEHNLSYFSHMNLEQCQEYHKKQEITVEEYLEICKQFRLTPTCWDSYIIHMADIRAYIWLGLFFRAHLERCAASAAHDCEIPLYYYNEYAARIQSQTIEEDSLMNKEIQGYAHKLKLYMNTMGWKTVTIDKLNEHAPDMFKALTSLAKNYRFIKDSSLESELDISVALKRILEVLDKAAIEPNKTIINTDTDEIFFPDHPQIKSWIELMVKNRILQSNFHHKQIRGQWFVREKLLELGKKMVMHQELDKPQDIFNCSIEAVSQAMKKFGDKDL